jgi:hypothetical protein
VCDAGFGKREKLHGVGKNLAKDLLM